MRKDYKLFREKKSKLFTQSEAEKLSGFTRRQLRTLEDNDLVVPHRLPSIVYDWNRIIFLKVLYNLRQDWSFQQIQSAFSQIQDIESTISSITNVLSILLVDETPPTLKVIDYIHYSRDNEIIKDFEEGNIEYLKHSENDKHSEDDELIEDFNYSCYPKYPTLEIFENLKYENDIVDRKFKKELNNSFSDALREKINKITLSSSIVSGISVKKHTIVIIADVINKLIVTGKELEIENFDLKVG